MIGPTAALQIGKWITPWASKSTVLVLSGRGESAPLAWVFTLLGVLLFFARVYKGLWCGSVRQDFGGRQSTGRGMLI